MRIAVTDGETRAALAAVRSLGRAGHEVDVLATRPGSLAGASRRAAREHVLPDPVVDASAWAGALRRLVEEERIDFVLPVTEVSIGCLHGEPTSLACRTALPAPGPYDLLVDKHLLLERARSLGFACPRSQLVADEDALQEAARAFGYPLVLKARRSRTRVGAGWNAGEAHVVRGAAGLRPAFEATRADGGALLQEFVPGKGEGITLLCAGGEPRVRFAHRRLREKPPGGGQSVLRESIEPDPALLASCERLLASLAWTGLAMVEVRRTPEGRAVLMEVNPRLCGSLQLAIDAGVDLPVLLLALTCGDALPDVKVRLGVRTRWLLGDFDHLLVTLRRAETRGELGVTRLGALRAFASSFFDGTRLEVLRRDDPAPFLRDLAGWLRELRA